MSLRARPQQQPPALRSRRSWPCGRLVSSARRRSAVGAVLSLAAGAAAGAAGSAVRGVVVAGFTRLPHSSVPWRRRCGNLAATAGQALVGADTFGGVAASSGTVVRIGQVFEMFSGIGGMRVAYQQARASLDEAVDESPRWRAMEVDDTCCEVYTEQFKAGCQRGVRAQELWHQPAAANEVWRCSIDKLPDEAFDGADLWLLSPPCQPFTRTGKQKGLDDSRCAALLRILEALPRLRHPPKALLLENVEQFMGSKAHWSLRSALKAAGMKAEYSVVDPTDFGFPNSRKRFYCCAWRSDASDAAGATSRVRVRWAPRPVREFCRLRHGAGVATEELRAACAVPISLLKRAGADGWEVDVATGASLVTKTFTASYGKTWFKEEGEGLSKAGPLLLTGADGWSPTEEPRGRFGAVSVEDFGRVRYFAPAELLALQGYPVGWGLPSRLTVPRQWRLIGNSINVAVVAELLRDLLARLA